MRHEPEAEASSTIARKKICSTGTTTAQRRVVIVGAGFAGLSAARTIQGSIGERCEVIVLEAGTCVGGRARESSLPSGTRVELGATWFHGICGNPLYEIAAWEGLVRDWRGDPGLRKHNITWKVDFARPRNLEVLQGRMKEIAEEALEKYQEVALQLSGDQPATDPSVGAFLRRKFDEIVKDHAFTPEELAVFSEAWLFREKQQCSFDGFFCTDDVSTSFPFEFESLDGPNMPVPGGFQAIAQSLATSLDIRFSHRVTGIEWGSGGVSITCANGVELEADAVILTTSIGVLQANHRTWFHPPLPDWKQAALSAVRLGVADKLFLEWTLPAATAGAPAAGAGQEPGPSQPQQQQQQQQRETSPTSSPHLSPAHPDGTGSGGPDSGGNADAGSGARQGGSAYPDYEDPWNLGRRGVVEERSIQDAARAAALAAAEVARQQQLQQQQQAASAMAVDRTSNGRPRRARRREEILSHAFMWPVRNPHMLGSAGASTQPLSWVVPFDGLPKWLYGIHSVRYNPGPCWIQPSEEEQFRVAQQQRLGHAGGSGGNDGGPSGSPPAVGWVDPGRASTSPAPPNKPPSAVLWITGDAALEMERLSEAELQRGVLQMLELFPSVPRPPGAGPPTVTRSRWGTDEMFLGSYSYTRAGVEDGEVVDVLAEPLCSETGLPVVMFAGEATHRHFMGTVHGAYMSGFREATRFMAAMEQQEALVAWSVAASAISTSVAQARVGSGVGMAEVQQPARVSGM